MTEEDFLQLQREANAEVDDAVAFAEASGYWSQSRISTVILYAEVTDER